MLNSSNPTLWSIGSLEIHSESAHPNRIPFKGVLTKVDEPSDKPPSGSHGHRVLIPKEVAAKALDTLLGMAVNMSYNFKSHDAKNKIGVILKAKIENNNIVVEGHLFGHDFPDEVTELRALSKQEQLGMSFEITCVGVEDPSQDIWRISELVFTGAAILKRDAAAYHSTALAATCFFQEPDHPTKRERGVIVKNKIKELTESLQALSAEIDAEDKTEAPETTDDGLDGVIAEVKKMIASAQSDKGAKSEDENIDAATIGFKSGKSNAFLRSMMRDMLHSMIMDSVKMNNEGMDEEEEDEGPQGLKKMLLRMLNVNSETEDKGEDKPDQIESSDDTSNPGGDDMTNDELKAQIETLTKTVSDLAEMVKASAQKEEEVEASKQEEAKQEVEASIDAANQETVPQRKTYEVDSSMFASKYGIDLGKKQKYTINEIDDLLDKQGLDTIQRMAVKHQLDAAGALQ